MSDTYEKSINEHNWKLYNAHMDRIKQFEQRQANEDDKTDRWMMTMASGSFGLSFAFIDKIVPLKGAVNIMLLISAWSCFLSVLVIGIIGFTVSSFLHLKLSAVEADALRLKYEGKEPEYKKRSILFSASAILGYASILVFIGGSICLILFITTNLLK
jgi:hypothetical protein